VDKGVLDLNRSLAERGFGRIDGGQRIP